MLTSAFEVSYLIIWVTILYACYHQTCLKFLWRQKREVVNILKLLKYCFNRVFKYFKCLPTYCNTFHTQESINILVRQLLAKDRCPASPRWRPIVLVLRPLNIDDISLNTAYYFSRWYIRRWWKYVVIIELFKIKINYWLFCST